VKTSGGRLDGRGEPSERDLQARRTSAKPGVGLLRRLSHLTVFRLRHIVFHDTVVVAVRKPPSYSTSCRAGMTVRRAARKGVG
jgi:hypothetical protein